MTLNLFQLQFQLPAFIINLEGIHQNLQTPHIQPQYEKCVTAQQLFLQYF